jgi:hypothetical protein
LKEINFPAKKTREKHNKKKFSVQLAVFPLLSGELE